MIVDFNSAEVIETIIKKYTVKSKMASTIPAAMERLGS